MKKRLFSLALVLVLCLTLLPTVSLADEPTTLDFQDGTWIELTSEMTELSAKDPTYYYLKEDVTVSETINVTGWITIDLNGHVLKKTGGGNTINGSYMLHIQDSNPEAIHKFTPDSSGLLTLDETNGTKTVTGGVIIGCVYNDSSFYMHGGNLIASADTHGLALKNVGRMFPWDGSIYGAVQNENLINGGNDSPTVFYGPVTNQYRPNDGKSTRILSGIFRGTVTNVPDEQLHWPRIWGGVFYETVVTSYNGSNMPDGNIRGGMFVTLPEHGIAANAKRYSITFQCGEGNTQKFTLVGDSLERPDTPTREGYAFAGWFTDEACKNPCAFDEAVTGDLTLYAGWTHVAHTGGTATCQDKAICSVCGEPYGDLAEHNYDTGAWGYKEADGHARVCLTPNCGEHDTVLPHTPDHEGHATEEYGIFCEDCGYEIETKLEHTHKFTECVVTSAALKTSATCTSRAVYYKSCVCTAVSTDEADTFTYGDFDPDKHSGYLSDWQHDDDLHWKEYSCCHIHEDEAEHTYTEGVCVCGKEQDLSLYAWLMPTLNAGTLSFTDVTSTDWFYDDVNYVNKTGLMTGTGADTFSPNAPVTRGMVMTILARRDGIKTDRYSPWYAAGVEWAVQYGISDGSNPEAAITREELATMLYRYAKLKGYDVTSGADTNILSFTDALEISDYAFEAMQWACAESILTGSNGALTPSATATRAQLAAMLHRLFG